MKKADKNAAWNAAKKAGEAAAKTGERNTYKSGTQCWILFELARERALRTTSSLCASAPLRETPSA